MCVLVHRNVFCTTKLGQISWQLFKWLIMFSGKLITISGVETH